MYVGFSIFKSGGFASEFYDSGRWPVSPRRARWVPFPISRTELKVHRVTDSQRPSAVCARGCNHSERAVAARLRLLGSWKPHHRRLNAVFGVPPPAFTERLCVFCGEHSDRRLRERVAENHES
ncbi:hypothetical protein H6P81_014133 [Aristolochia fimbriata]|uniref:Uncharacterized protein n=1 Tax=Aristolochia fimbriata TaxID=158543 RepID=A0AAV7EGM9_ARIFI|nr:hypothetical protein H6P81_014133 [Aristolochia fimbriata]